MHIHPIPKVKSIHVHRGRTLQMHMHMRMCYPNPGSVVVSGGKKGEERSLSLRDGGRVLCVHSFIHPFIPSIYLYCLFVTIKIFPGGSQRQRVKGGVRSVIFGLFK